MITPTKPYSTNPFVDNVIYYGKLMAMNCTIKDEEEALANETKESLYAGDVLIACVEGSATYEMFKRIPQEIIEKYIAITSNLDMYIQNPDYLKVRLDSYGLLEKNMIINRLSSLARTVYIDHYDTMSSYITDVAGTDWLIKNESLYNACMSADASYNELFDAIPLRTNLRVLKAYLNFHDYLDLAILWDPESKITKADVAIAEASSNQPYDSSLRTKLTDDSVIALAQDYNPSDSKYLNQFRAYIILRADNAINSDLTKISKAMREIFISHYNMMEERKYFSSEANEPSPKNEGAQYNLPAWMDYFFDRSTYEMCKNGSATWVNLYNLFPDYALKESLEEVLGDSTVNEYGLLTDSDTLEIYFNSYCTDPYTKQLELNSYMIDKYIKNYQLYLNKSVYFACLNDNIDIFGLYEYLPNETLKMIIDTEIPEVTNTQTYAESKKLLNSYLNTLSPEQAEVIKQNITKDMIKWYPENHIETNNYYRSLIGLPPMDKNGNVYKDTLIHTYDASSGSFVEFGDRYISQVPTSIYPEQHWRKELYEFDSYDISVLNEYGIIEDYISGCKTTLSNPRYRYIRYLGDEKLNLYECRKAMNFDLIGMPPVDDPDIKKKFVDAYTINQDYIVRSVYSDAYNFQSDYYNKFIIIFILVNTIMDLVAGIPDYIINRDVFDARCIKYLFESFGIPYYSEIPIKYQQAMLKNLNVLIKYKSSTKNMVDICNLFGFSDAKVFGYYLMKSHNVNPVTGDFIFKTAQQTDYPLEEVYVLDNSGETSDITGKHFTNLVNYSNKSYYLKTISIKKDDGSIVSKNIVNTDRDGLFIYNAALQEMIPIKTAEYFNNLQADTSPASLKFIKVPLDRPFIDYKNDDNYAVQYDDVTQEITWDGGLDHDYLKNKILDYEFNAVKSKYISIETVTDLTEMAFQMSYFYSMLFDNLYSEDLINLNVPSIKENHKFRFTDIICFLFAMTYYYAGLEDNIMYSPTQILYVKGYNFNDVLNTIFQDEKFYTQNDSYGQLEDYEKTNIFDINERISQDGYNYRNAASIEDNPSYPKGYDLTFDTPQYYVKGFNLEIDIDELEKWLNEECQMSLDDFVVSTNQDEFGKILSLRHFYSLNNSYYQKSIFNGSMKPLPYNNFIKYAYSFYLSKILYTNDIAFNPHKYINDNGATRVITPVNNSIYVLSDLYYAYNDSIKAIPLYRVFTKNGLNYELSDTRFYILNGLGLYEPIVDGDIYIKNEYGYRFATDVIYILENDEYRQLDTTTDSNYIYIDSSGRRILNFGDYYIEQDGQFILNPDNCYVLAVIDGEERYILLKDVSNYAINVNTDSDCFIIDDDGHFIKFEYTDYYIRTHLDIEQSNQMLYTKQDLFVKSLSITEYYDKSLDNEDRVYYRKLSEDNDYTVNNDVLYVKTIDGRFIDEQYIVSPNNCWYIFSTHTDNDGQQINDYRLVTSGLYSYNDNADTISSENILVLKETDDYAKYSINGNAYIEVDTNPIKYIVNSDNEYITVLDTSKQYSETNKLMVIFNRAMLSDGQAANTEVSSYNPSLNDGIWDENDWYYSEGENNLGMSGENMWYYKKHAQEPQTNNLEINMPEAVGSGWYLPADQYIGETSIVNGKEYYLAMDIECNFDGTIQLYNTADSGASADINRVYNVRANEKQHVSQVFKANNVSRPDIRIIKYNFDTNPINIGDYVIISNIKISSAHNDNYIPNDIPSINELQDIYKTNRAIYKYLVTQMRNTSSKKMYDIYKKLYGSLMVCKYNKEAFKLADNTYAKTYTEFLQSRDEALYDRLQYVKSLDAENMKKEITDSIIEISYELDSLLTEDGLQYIYSYFPAVGTTFIQQYIFKVINWFKSWKVQLLGINSVYRFGNSSITDANGNTIAELSGDEFTVKILYDENFDINIAARLKDAFVTGTLKIDVDTTMSNKVGIRDRIRVITRKSNSIAFTDDQLHIMLTDDSSTVTVKNGNILTIKTINGDEFTVNTNQLLMSTDENPNDAFVSQLIDEINLLSGDYIDYGELEDDDDE